MELNKSRIFTHFWIREDEWGRDFRTLQGGVQPLEGAWSQETSVDSGLLGLSEDQEV